jgi:hypothetical protein
MSETEQKERPKCREASCDNPGLKRYGGYCCRACYDIDTNYGHDA